MLSSAANALRALEYLVEQGEAGVSDLGRHLGVTIGTAHRLVITLVETGFAEQNAENRRYRPSAKLARIAGRVRDSVDPREVLHGHLERLAAEVRETVNLGVLDGADILYVDKVMSDQLFGIEARIGGRLPARETALGMAILATADSSTLTRVLRRFNAGGGESREEIRDRLAEIARRGFAEDLGLAFSDVYCVAAPVLGVEGTSIAAISVSVPRSRFDAARESLRSAVTRTAAGASQDMADLGLAALPSAGSE